MLTVVGFPRSGTNFLTRMLAHYMDGSDAEVWPGTPAHPKVNKIHWKYQAGELGWLTHVYIFRDPRDCALSGWEYVKHHYAPELDLMEFLECHFSGHWDLWPCGWREHIRYWLAQEILDAKYENLCVARERILPLLIRRLDLKWDEERLAHAVEQSYNFGERHDRRWASELPKEAAAWLDDYCGDLMRELGYA
jgi:hypothetical protein